MIEKRSNGSAPVVAVNLPFLERPRLEKLLEKAVNSTIVTVTAGAGYGKSQAVYAFARQYDARTTWVQLSEADNSGEHFWENFIHTAAIFSPEALEELAEMGFPSSERSFNRYLSIPRVKSVTAEKYLIVYDDVHLIQNRAVLDFIQRRVSLPLRNVTSVLISRLPLSGPGGEALIDLSVPQAKGRVTRITEDDLRFTHDETVEYLRLLGLNPSAQMVSEIYRDTEGWAVALNLAGLSVRNSRSSYMPGALRSNIFRLMESEIFSGLQEKLKKFLVKISLVEHRAPELLREIAGGSSSLVDGLEQTGSFVRYDAYQNVYTIHQLFYDFLKRRQNEIPDSEKRKVWEKAAAWCLRNNYKMDAIAYYEKCGDYRKLLDAVYTFPLLLPKPLSAMLLKIMDAIPEDQYEKIPEAWLTRPRLLLMLGMLDRAEAELKAVISRLEALPEKDSGSARLLAGCYNLWGFQKYAALIYTRDYSFTECFEQAHYYSRISKYRPPPSLTVLNVSSYICRVAANDPKEMERHNKAIALMVYHLSSSMNGCGYGLDDLAEGELAFFKNDHNEAERHFRTALEKACEKGQYEIESHALFFLMRIYLFKGNGSAFPGLLKQMEQQREQVRFSNRQTYFDIAYGWLYVQTGQPEKIAPWLKSGFEESDLNSMIYGFEILVKAGYQFAKKRYPAALADLSGRDNRYGAFTLLLGRLEVKVLESVCRYRMNDFTGAFRDLEAAWELARGSGLLAPFAEKGKDMRALAGAAIKDGTLTVPVDVLEKIRRLAAQYSKNIYSVSAVLRDSQEEKSKKNRPGAALSSREMDVLSCLSQGLTREEIARVLSISINTVKSVARSIFIKLNAVNRADAVRIAAKMGLL